MERIDGLPEAGEAEALLEWAAGENPGPWANHVRVAARAARTIAQACGLDPRAAYLMGLLHDIGRYEGVRHLHHVIAGYDLMMEKGWPRAARICLTHSFPVQALEAYPGRKDCTEAEMDQLRQLLGEAEYDDYDRLIQLCDVIASAEGVCLLETRLMDVIRRYGVNDYTQRKVEAFYGLYDTFCRLCGRDVYHLFQQELQTFYFHRDFTPPRVDK